jgi:LysR family transcriptional regulator, regulator of abg operon
MKLSQLREFLAVAERGSIRGAAKLLGVSSPALTKSLRQLETELHVRLVVRTTRGAVLSEYGEAFLKRARVIVAESAKATEEMAQMLGRHQGDVTVGVSPTPAIAMLPRALIEFRSDFPAVRVNLVGGLYHAHIPSLRARTMDMAISPIPQAGLETGFQSEVLFRSDLVIVARHGHPLQYATALHELVDAEWIVTAPGSRSTEALVEAFLAHGLAPPLAMIQCDSFSVLQTLVLQSDMVCALPRKFVETEPFRSCVCALPLVDALPSYTVSLFYLTDSPLVPAAAYFATLLRRHARYLQPSPTNGAVS